jgi:hypothetical protein
MADCPGAKLTLRKRMTTLEEMEVRTRVERLNILPPDVTCSTQTQQTLSALRGTQKDKNHFGCPSAFPLIKAGRRFACEAST